jgi:hypothetical protein
MLSIDAIQKVGKKWRVVVKVDVNHKRTGSLFVGAVASVILFPPHRPSTRCIDALKVPSFNVIDSLIWHSLLPYYVSRTW